MTALACAPAQRLIELAAAMVERAAVQARAGWSTASGPVRVRESRRGYCARMTTRGRIAGLVDAALEATVIGGFSRVGPLVRGRLEQWADPPRMDGRICVVTGASGGLGLAAATDLARLGASLRLLVRDAGRGED